MRKIYSQKLATQCGGSALCKNQLELKYLWIRDDAWLTWSWMWSFCSGCDSFRWYHSFPRRILILQNQDGTERPIFPVLWSFSYDGRVTHVFFTLGGEEHFTPETRWTPTLLILLKVFKNTFLGMKFVKSEWANIVVFLRQLYSLLTFCFDLYIRTACFKVSIVVFI